MNIVRSVSEMETLRSSLTGSVGTVPTMGYLHEGHLSLVRRSVAGNDHTVAWIFVNPTQFGPNEDLAQYPRNEERDLKLLDAEGVDVVFIPAPDDVYPPGFNEWVEVRGSIAERLEGAHRPGHFRGVTTVVARMFRIIQPHRAYFGRKDAQQLRVVEKMVEEQRLAVEIVAMPIVREEDGLAMSSRNVYLSPGERRAALVLSRALQLAEASVLAGETDAGRIRAKTEALIVAEPLASLDYVSVSDPRTFEELTTIDRPALLLVAARIGSTRLIDNVLLQPVLVIG